MGKTFNDLFQEQIELRSNRQCPMCRVLIGDTISSFKDEASKDEFKISGLCQSCQDESFGEDRD